MKVVDREWMMFAACRDMAPKSGERDIFFPEQPAGLHAGGPTMRARSRRARAVCRICLVEDECCCYAKTIGVESGVWGGKLFSKKGNEQ